MKKQSLNSIIICVFIFLFTQITFAQNVGIGTTNPDESAKLEITSTTQGILVPRMTSSQRNTISNPAIGLLVFDTTTNSFWFYDGTSWNNLFDSNKGVFENKSGIVRNTGNNVTDDFVFGSDSLTGPLDTMFFFDKSKAAFRTGKTSNGAWNPDSIGVYSFAAGFKPKAIGENSIAMSYNAQALKEASIAIGENSYCKGLAGLALGHNAKVFYHNSIAIGYNAEAKDTITLALGYNTEATNKYASAIGNRSIASGKYSVSLGNDIEAQSGYEIVLGHYNEIYTPFSIDNFDFRDRLFVIGNGLNSSNRKNALTLLKSGKLGLGTSSPTQQLTLTNSMEIPNATAADTGVIYVGGERFIHNYTNTEGVGRNTFIGKKAGNFSISGAGLQGSENTGVGFESLNNISTGSQNTSIGTYALLKLDSGVQNVGIGAQSLYYLDEGDQNTGLGYASLFSTRDGEKNVGIGYGALANKYNIHNNTVVGYNAASANSGASNEILGNCIFGYEAGDSLTTGDYNICIGYQAGNDITSGNRNIIIGHDLDAPLDDADDQLYIGGLIYGDLNEKKVGIGTISPSARLHVKGNSYHDGDFIIGGESLISTNDTLMFFDKSKGAFRFGEINNSNWQTDSIGNLSIALGKNAKAKNYLSIAIGTDVESLSTSSIAIGNCTKAEGTNSLALGTSTKAIGYGSTSTGFYTTATGSKSATFGNYTEACSAMEFVIGQYNTTYTPDDANYWDNDDRLFVIGNGSSYERRDAMRVMKNGQISIGNHNPDHLFSIYGTKTITDGTDGVFMDIQNSAPTLNVLSGLRFRNGYTNNTFKGGIYYQDKASNGRGNILFVNNGSNSATNATTADTRMIIEYDGNVGIGNHSPDHLFSIYGTETTTNGTNGVFMDIQNSAATNDVLCGLRFRNGYENNTFKGGIYYQDKASNGRGNILFVNNGNASSVNATAADTRMVIEYGGDVGIGITDPQSKLHVDGYEILSTGNNCGFKFRERGSTSANDDWVWYADNNYARLYENGTGDILYVRNNGLFGVGRQPTTNKLEVNGNASKTTAGDWLANSDKRLKKNITQLNGEEILQKLLQLKGVNFEWNDDKTGFDRPEGIQYGMIAQNIQKVFPDLVSTDNQGYLQTAYGTYDAMYIEAFRAMNNKIAKLEQENALLKSKLSEVDQLKAELENIKLKIEDAYTKR